MAETTRCPPSKRPDRPQARTTHSSAAAAHGPARLAHHFDDPAQQYEAAVLGMWVFLVTEVMFFGGAVRGLYGLPPPYPRGLRGGQPRAGRPLGTFNTVVLLTSSLTMALAVRAAHLGKRRPLIMLSAERSGSGLRSSAIKFYEYYHKYDEGHDAAVRLAVRLGRAAELPGPAALFFSLYFGMTGMHALHMIIGIGILAVLIFLAVRRRFTEHYYTPVEMIGLYWHFVDLVWVFLFPLLYLIGGISL